MRRVGLARGLLLWNHILPGVRATAAAHGRGGGGMSRSVAVLVTVAVVALVYMLPGVGAADWGLYRRLYDHNHKND